MPVIDLKNIKTEKDKNFGEKLKDVWNNTKRKTGESIEWIKENPKEAVGIFAASATIVGGIGKTISKHVTAKQVQYNKERFIYDHSLNAYLETNRKLTNNDVIQINEERRKTGKKLSEVLAEMHLLK